MKYKVLCVQWQFSPRGNVPLVSLNRCSWLRGGADAGFNSCYAACACGKKYRREKKAGGGGAETQLGSCTAGKMKYTALCIQWQVNLRGDIPSAS